jgi:hypothetical protein
MSACLQWNCLSIKQVHGSIEMKFPSPCLRFSVYPFLCQTYLNADAELESCCWHSWSGLELSGAHAVSFPFDPVWALSCNGPTQNGELFNLFNHMVNPSLQTPNSLGSCNKNTSKNWESQVSNTALDCHSSPYLWHIRIPPQLSLQLVRSWLNTCKFSICDDFR